MQGYIYEGLKNYLHVVRKKNVASQNGITDDLYN